MFLLKDLKLAPRHTENELKLLCAAKLCTDESNIKEIKIVKKSIDARKKTSVYVIYTVSVSLFDEEGIKGEAYSEPQPLKVVSKKLSCRPVIVGFGPAGMFAGLYLAEAGCRPIILERGKSVEKRTVDVTCFEKTGLLLENSNIQFGEGGAGTFSDGKLGTGISSPLIRSVYQTFVECGADGDILYSAKPHIGSDVLPVVVKNIRKRIESFGGEIRFETNLEDIIIKDGRVCGVVANGDEIDTDTVLLGIGHSARGTFEMLYNKGVPMCAKAFSVGVRIEHLQKDISRAQFGDFAKDLPPADYKLSTHLSDGLGVYTFCMCPGGYVSAAASENGGVVTNGYSKKARDGINSNSAVLVSVTPDIFENNPMKGIEFQRRIEKAAFNDGFKAPCQLVGDFLRHKDSTTFGEIMPTYPRGVVLGSIDECLPGFICNAVRRALPVFARRISGFDRYDAVITAPETRSSSPLRIIRDAYMQSPVRGLYPIGEGSGYSGGITSSAVDGLRAAMAVTE